MGMHLKTVMGAHRHASLNLVGSLQATSHLLQQRTVVTALLWEARAVMTEAKAAGQIVQGKRMVGNAPL